MKTIKSRRNYIDGTKSIVNYIYRNRFSTDPEERNKIPYIDLEKIDFEDILDLEFNAYTLAHILDCYTKIDYDEYRHVMNYKPVKELIEKYNIPTKVLKLMIQIDSTNILAIPDSRFDKEFIDYLVSYINPEWVSEDVYKPGNYMFLRSLFSMCASEYDVDMEEISFNDRIDKGQEVINYIYRDNFIEKQDENIRLKDIKVIKLEHTGYDEIEKYEFDEYTKQQIRKYYFYVNGRFAPDEYEKRLIEHIGDYPDYKDVPASLRFNPRVKAAYIEYYRKNVGSIGYGKDILAEDIVNNREIQKIFKEYVKDHPEKYRLHSLPLYVLTDISVRDSYKEYIKKHPYVYGYRELPLYIQHDQGIIEAYKAYVVNHPRELERQDFPKEIREDEQIKKAYREDVMRNPQKHDYDLLPRELANDETIKQIYQRLRQIYTYNGRDEEGYDKNWLDSEGNLKEFFEIILSDDQKVEIKSRDDYVKLVRNFIASEVSIEEYCRKYNITSVDGFKKLLDRLSEEDPVLRDQIKEKNNATKDIAFAALVGRTHKIYNGEMNLTEFFDKKTAKLCVYSKMLEVIERSSKLTKTRFKETLAKELYKHITENEYNLHIKKMLHYFEIEINKDKGINETVCSALADQVKKLIVYNYPSEYPSERYRYAEQAAVIIRGYGKRYDRNKLYSKIMVDGEMIDVTDEHVDEMLAYIEINHLPKNLKVANHILKQVVTGDLDYSKELEELKAKKQDDLFELKNRINQYNSVDDYISHITL